MLYYYSRLSDAMRQAYDTILDGIQCMRTEITLPGAIGKQALAEIAAAVNYDHPELFWWRSSIYHCTISPLHTRIYFQYTGLSPSEIRERCAKLIEWKVQVTEAVLQKAERHPLTTVDKVWLIGNHLAARMTYSNSESIPFIDRHSVWGAYSGAGVCESIAKGFQFIVSDNPALRIDGIFVAGNLHTPDTPGCRIPNHAWNAIVEDGYVFHFDLTAQIRRAHIPALGASKALLFTPEQMRDRYSLCAEETSPLYVPETCRRIKYPG